jgi:tRNA uridine 5-carbamoylmethylation protein Kti12
MLIVNLFGGPGCGKSTTAAALFAHLKNNGVRAELVHEAAKRFIYKGATAQLKNQVYVLAKQWSHIEDLDRAGCEVAISDSPLICNLMYAESHGYYPELKALALKLDDIYPQKNVFIGQDKEL